MRSIIVFLIFFYVSVSLAQKPVYPVIFIHGINSSDETWESSINFLHENFGWDDPYSNNGIFHAVLNAHVIIDDDNLRGLGQSSHGVKYFRDVFPYNEEQQFY